MNIQTYALSELRANSGLRSEVVKLGALTQPRHAPYDVSYMQYV